MAKTRNGVVAALDIGTNKVVCFVARVDGQGAGLLAPRVAAHAVRDDAQEAALGTVLHLRLRQARLLNLERLAQHSDQELVLVRWPDLAGVG